MKSLGLDCGNGAIKTSTGIMFDNLIKVGWDDGDKQNTKVFYDDTPFTIGVGSKNTGDDKFKNENYKVSVLTAIAKSFKENNIELNLVVGCPIETYNKRTDIREKCMETILSWGPSSIQLVDGDKRITKYITIKDVRVFPESAIVYGDPMKYQNKRTLVIDFGAGTLDCSLWSGFTQEKYFTYKQHSMNSLYKKINNVATEVYKANTKLTTEDAKKMIQQDTYLIDQQEVSLKPIKKIIEAYIVGVASDINEDFDFASCDYIELIGGGALALKDYFLNKEKSYIPCAEINENPVFANANMYQKAVAMIEWKEA